MLARTACHVHSDWSYDGKWSLERLAESFSKRGYRAVLLTEHDQGFDETRRLKHREACQKASSEKILMVAGIEYSDASNTIHLLVWGDIPFLGSKVEPDQILAAVKEKNGVVVLAHPSRKDAWKRFNPAWKESLHGIELWNRKTDGWAPSLDAVPLLQMTRALPFVGMDFHNARQFFPLSTILEVGTSITETTILAALRSRRCVSKAFGREVDAFTNGMGAKVLRPAECLRRVAASCYRRARTSIGSIAK